MIDKVIYKVGDKYVYVLDWISVYVRYVLYEINWVDCGGYEGVMGVLYIWT